MVVPRTETTVDVMTERGRYDVYRPHLDTPGNASAPPAESPVIQVIADDRVIFNIEAMEIGRPYSYRLGGEWLAAIKRADGKIDSFALR